MPLSCQEFALCKGKGDRVERKKEWQGIFSIEDKDYNGICNKNTNYIN
jgi:hypothetical protein